MVFEAKGINKQCSEKSFFPKHIYFTKWLFKVVWQFNKIGKETSKITKIKLPHQTGGIHVYWNLISLLVELEKKWGLNTMNPMNKTLI